jgi:hypothetical protein
VSWKSDDGLFAFKADSQVYQPGEDVDGNQIKFLTGRSNLTVNIVRENKK